MNTRLSSSTICFRNSFFLPGYPGELPAGKYQLGIEEEIMSGLTFTAYRRTGTYLTVRGTDGHIEMRAITQQDLDEALLRDRDVTGIANPGVLLSHTRKMLS